MIVRDGADGALILIAQTDHAKVSGQCAAHWGNKTFARPEPNEAVVRAAMFHDSGWYDYEASPTIAPDTGRPLNFMQVPWGKPQRQAYEWAIEWMTGIDPYSGLLISKHRTGLQRGRYDKVAHPKFFNTQNLPEDNEDFLARNEATQAERIKGYDQAEFWTNYQLLQAFDLISLFLCNKDVVDDYIDPVPTSYDGKSPAVARQFENPRRPADRGRSIPLRRQSACACSSSGGGCRKSPSPIRRRSARPISRRFLKPSTSFFAPADAVRAGISPR